MEDIINRKEGAERGKEITYRACCLRSGDTRWIAR